MYRLNVALFAACAVMWFANGIKHGDILDYIIAVLWLAGCILNIIRYLQEKKNKED